MAITDVIAARTTFEHAKAHPPVPGAGPRAAALRAPAADPQPRSHEDEQAQEPDRDDDYIAQGYIREALVNYLALLGWATGTEEEILALDEIVQRFDIPEVHKGGAVFDRERLEWLNGQWIRRLTADELIDRLRPFLDAELEPAASSGCRPTTSSRTAAGGPGAAADARCDR